MYRSKTLATILLAPLTLTLMVPAVSSISLFQQAKAAMSGQSTNSSTINYKEISPPVKFYS